MANNKYVRVSEGESWRDLMVGQADGGGGGGFGGGRGGGFGYQRNARFGEQPTPASEKTGGTVPTILDQNDKVGLGFHLLFCRLMYL
jgi:hypothetical protein